ncbi:MAG: hypothetical protein H3C57_00065 [Gammaproteobacteria bacterium]|nr:hypothetical protein [Gammaproteobacteria bacterium]
MSSSILQRDHRSIRGLISYTSDKPERRGQERGREYFMINTHGDGRRTCIAHCEIDDRPSVMRDITYSLDEDWYPTDCFVRIAVNDRFMGSGWFRFAADFAECETYTAIEGRVTQRMETGGRLKSFQNHSIQCDAWHLRLYDRNRGGVQVIEELLLSSPDHRGATGPLLFRAGLCIDFVGEESLRVAAGEFRALHFKYVSAPGLPVEHPPYDIWCTADGEFIFLKGVIGGYMQTCYELTELVHEKA